MVRRRLEEPNMSDNLLLVKVEDLINMAMGPADKNVVNYKLVQMVLHILARHLRMLETEVEIRMSEEQDKAAEKEKRKPRTREGSIDSASRSPESGRGRHMEDIDERHERGGRKERDKSEKRKQKQDGATSKEREKEEKASAKEKEKAEQAATKDKDKTEKADRREKEKADKPDRMGKEKVDKADRMEKEKVDKADRMEKEKVDKADRTDREKSEKADRVEKGRPDKADRKTKERAEKDVEKADETVRKDQTTERGRERKGRGGSGTSIVVTEKQKQKDKILVVEKGPTTRTDSRTRVGSIEVVTLSQFELLETAVNNLKALTGPLPSPALPDNKQLMEDIANGTASLTDIMQAMQVTARIQAAEQAISRMAGLLTQLAAAGAIPEELVDMVEEVKADVDEVAAAAVAATAATAAAAAAAAGEATGVSEDAETVSAIHLDWTSSDIRTTDDSMKSRPLAAARKSVAVDAITSRPSTARGEATRQARPLATTAKSATSASRMAPVPPVTHKEMDDALRALREDLNKNMNLMTGKATSAADSASATAKRVAEKLDIALQLNSRISNLFSLVNDYAEQLSGFDTGLTSQMQGFQDQMAQMRSDLKTGMVQLSQAGGGGETTAVMELRERYDLLVVELDTISHDHQALETLQKQLEDELRTLVESVEMLREQKADRDEVLDGLKDKADISRLSGLLTEKTFAAIRTDLERRLDLCHEKFMKQENVWMNALKELTEILENKAELMQLMATRDETQQELRDLHERLRRLAEILGDPKAAILTRQLARDATCGACMVPALMSPWDENYGSPPPLPAMRPRPTGAPAEEPSESCLQDLIPLPPLDTKAHTCQRWVGGSHTLISDSVTKEKAPPMHLTGPPTKRYTGYGTDGRLYMLEEELQPCIECNIILAPHDTKEGNIGNVPKHGAGDQGDVTNTDKK